MGTRLLWRVLQEVSFLGSIQDRTWSWFIPALGGTQTSWSYLVNYGSKKKWFCLPYWSKLHACMECFDRRRQEMDLLSTRCEPSRCISLRGWGRSSCSAKCWWMDYTVLGGALPSITAWSTSSAPVGVYCCGRGCYICTSRILAYGDQFGRGEYCNYAQLRESIQSWKCSSISDHEAGSDQWLPWPSRDHQTGVSSRCLCRRTARCRTRSTGRGTATIILDLCSMERYQWNNKREGTQK